MSLSSKNMLDVMAWADGELEGAEAKRVEALIEKDKDAKELVRSFGALGDFVRDAESKSSKPTPDLVDAVMAGIGPNDIERARLKRGMRARVAAVAVTLTALAAGVFLYQRSQPPVDPIGHAPIVPAATGVEVGQVDTSQHAVAVFYVPSDEGSKGPETTVVWIDDTPQPPPE